MIAIDQQILDYLSQGKNQIRKDLLSLHKGKIVHEKYKSSILKR